MQVRLKRSCASFWEKMCYGFDADALAPLVERVGFEIEELLAPADAETLGLRAY